MGAKNELHVGDEHMVLHKLVFDNDMTALCAALASTEHDIDGLDMHGNTPLLLAIGLGRAGHKPKSLSFMPAAHCCKDNGCLEGARLLSHVMTLSFVFVMLWFAEAAAVLMEHGADTGKKNSDRWPPLAEAVSFGHRPTVKAVLAAHVEQMRKMVKDKTTKVLRAVQALPSFYMEINWEFHSWVPLVSRVLPSDTLRIWKQGGRIRMDSTLLDVSEQSVHRGDISVLLLGHDDGAGVDLVSLRRGEKVYQRKPLFMSDDELMSDEHAEAIDDQVDLLMTSTLSDVDCPTRNIEFSRALAGWYGFREERTEEVGEYQCRVFNISGMEFVNRSRREHLTPEDIARNKEIHRLLRANPEDIEERLESLKPPSRSLPAPPRQFVSWAQYAAGERTHLGRSQALSCKSKKFSATAWMCDDFPLDIESVVQLLTILAPTAKHVARLRDFVNSKMPTGFPVKLDIPVFPTVSARVHFSKYEARDLEDDLFDIPEDFEEVVFHDKRKQLRPLRRRPLQPGQREHRSSSSSHPHSGDGSDNEESTEV
eukprot:m.67433 g.67433  ORF g.67433 m.67433 type:complete len:538 (+) comp13829_c0_seq3:319-1932(+)